MRNDNRIFEDLAKIANGAIGSLSGIRQDIESRLQGQMERMLSRMNLVTREEFDATKAMIVAAREEQMKLQDRLLILEAKLEAAEKASPRGQ